MKADFGAAIHALRVKKGVSQRRAATDLGISQALMSHYENGAREPKLPFVKKLCAYYGVSVDFVLRDSSEGAEARETSAESESAERLFRMQNAVLAAAVKAGGSALLEAMETYISLALGKLNSAIAEPNKPYNPAQDAKIRLAEAAIYELTRHTAEVARNTVETDEEV
ncbi:MAG: helix-turn-helix domain-containing protein [Oscillospiraceae bacterium]|jgi:transcriptional regulator with XRE-family HTH domain|nr:helix-turn-helix domain-containing protein [Oscillospiraceae bacterium]